MKFFKYLFFLAIFSTVIFSAMSMNSHKSFKWTKGYDDYTEPDDDIDESTDSDSDNEVKSFEWEDGFDDYDEEINSLRTLLQSMNISSNTQEPFKFLDLPEEMQQKVASFFSDKYLYNLSLSCKSVRNILLAPSPFAKTNEILNQRTAACLISDFIFNKITFKQKAFWKKHMSDSHFKSITIPFITECLSLGCLSLSFSGKTIDPQLLNLIVNILEKTNMSKKILHLDLSDNQVTYLPVSIRNLTQLEDLNLSLNDIEDLPDSLENLTSLKTLDLSSNKLTVLPFFIEKLSLLEELDLSLNNLENLPESLKKLKQLKTLDLSNNKLPKGLVDDLKKALPNTRIIS